MQRSWLLMTSYLALGTALAAGAQTSPESVQARSIETEEKPPWEWTVEERLEAQKEWDVLRHEAAGLRIGEVPQHSLPSLRGSENPELIFPTRLFQQLITLFYTSTPDGVNGWREMYAEDVARYLGPPDEVVYDLEKAAAEIIWIHRRCLELANRLEAADVQTQLEIRAEIKATQERSCRARFVGLENARKLFGAEALHRFLYEVVAKDFFTGLAEGPLMTVGYRRWVEGGCQ
jgi:hypothetical protein